MKAPWRVCWQDARHTVVNNGVVAKLVMDLRLCEHESFERLRDHAIFCWASVLLTKFGARMMISVRASCCLPVAGFASCFIIPNRPTNYWWNLESSCVYVGPEPQEEGMPFLWMLARPMPPAFLDGRPPATAFAARLLRRVLDNCFENHGGGIIVSVLRERRASVHSCT